MKRTKNATSKPDQKAEHPLRADFQGPANRQTPSKPVNSPDLPNRQTSSDGSSNLPDLWAVPGNPTDLPNRRTFLKWAASGTTGMVLMPVWLAEAFPAGGHPGGAEDSGRDTNSGGDTLYTGKVFVEPELHDDPALPPRGLGGVVVSDGHYTTITGQDGTFRLQGGSNARFVFITVPAGYKCARTHYIPVQAGLETYNFGLLPHEASAGPGVRFIQLADTETHLDTGWVGPVRDYATGENAAFIIHTGDIAYERGFVYHSRHVTSQTMGVPVFYCVGNHDLDRGDYGEQLFEQHFGPCWYSFDAGNTHFVVTPMPGGTYRPSYTVDQVRQWLENDLKYMDRSKNLVVFNHNLLTTGDDFMYGESDKEQIRLNDFNLKAWIYGHWHINFRKHHAGNEVVSVCASPPNKGGINHSASNFLVFDLDDHGKMRIQPRYTYLDSLFTVVSPSGAHCARDVQGHLVVSVNTYTARSATRRVRFRVDGSEQWHELSPRTDWNWTGVLPSERLWPDVSALVRYEVTLEDGSVFTRSETFFLPEGGRTAGGDNMQNAGHSAGQTDRATTSTFPERARVHRGYPASFERDLLRLEWSTNAGGSIWMCRPVIEQGVVYAATIDEFAGERCALVAMDARTGVKLWKYPLQASVKNSICVEQGLVLATDEEGTAYGVNAVNGREVWKKALGWRSLPAYVSGGTVVDGIYYTGYGNYLSAVRVEDGSVLWTNTGWNGGHGTTANHLVAGDTLVVGANWQALYGHNRHTGEVLWREAEHGIRFRSAAPAFVDGQLFVPALNALLIMDPVSGEVLRIGEVPHSLQTAATPVVLDEIILLGTARDGVLCLDRQTLEVRWRSQTTQALVYTAPYSMPPSATVEGSAIRIENRVVFGASDGGLYIVDVEDGRVIDRIDMGAPILATPVKSHNSLFVADFSGNVNRFAIQSA